MLTPVDDLAQVQARAEAFRTANPRARARDVAQGIGVSEADLLRAKGESEVIRLRPDWPAIFERLAACGPLMALTRNESCVIEKEGAYTGYSSVGPMGQVVGHDIDLRLFFTRWALGFAVEETVPSGRRRSLQFFSTNGEALHKIYTRAETDLEAFDRLVRTVVATDPEPPSKSPAAPVPPSSGAVGADEARRAELLDGWRALRDTHEFVPLLRRLGLDRLQAIRLVQGTYARRVLRTGYRDALAAVAGSTHEFMCFVGNPGCLQIHHGRLHRLVPAEGWLNVLDPGFNLHLREERVAECWVVTKPTSEGDCTSLELFDAAGENIAILFSDRKGGPAEESWWTENLERLPANED